MGTDALGPYLATAQPPRTSVTAMTESPPPPPPPHNPPIPPTSTASMAPPPGYAAYQGTEFAQGGLSRTKSLSTAIVVLLGVVSLGQMIALATSGSVRNAARDFRVDGDEDAFNESLVLSGLSSALVGLVTLSIVVVSIIWLRRIASNHQRLGRTVTWTPGWAIAGWLLPPFLFVIPLLMLRESWKAADPQSPPGAPTWKSGSESPLPWIWFVLYSVVPLILGIIGSFAVFSTFGGDLEDTAERLIDDFGITIINGLVAIAGAISWGVLVRALTARHTQLTGEARTQ